MHFFNEDNTLVKVLGTIGNLVVLNLIFLLCCVPVVTIGDALCSLYFALMHRLRDDSSGLVKDFFSSMRSNFRQATLSWLICLVLIFVLYGDFRIFSPAGLSPNTAFFYFFVILGALIFFTAEYVFPVIASFENKLPVLYTNSFTFAAKNPGGTILLAVIQILPMAFCIWDKNLWPLYAAIWFFIGFAFIAYACSFIYLRIFTPYLPKSANAVLEEEQREHGK